MAWDLLKRLWSHIAGDSPPEGTAAYLARSSSWAQYGSTCLSGAAYHNASRILAVRFKASGKVYWYLNVPPMVWQQLQAAPSKGRYYASAIRNSYDYRGPIG